MYIYIYIIYIYIYYIYIIYIYAQFFKELMEEPSNCLAGVWCKRKWIKTTKSFQVKKSYFYRVYCSTAKNRN